MIGTDSKRFTDSLIIAERWVKIVIIVTGKSRCGCSSGAWVFLGLPF